METKTIKINLSEEMLLSIRGTLRLFSEDDSQGLATIEDLNKMIVALGGRV